MEFLLENPFILIALFALISSFFSKGKGAAKEEQKRRQQQRPIGEVKPFQTFEEMLFPETVKEKSPTIPEKEVVDKQVVHAKAQMEAKIAALQEERKKIEAKTARISTVSRLQQPQMMEVEQSESRSFDVDATKLVDGIIWSEILGPPRSKKRHRPVNRNIG